VTEAAWPTAQASDLVAFYTREYKGRVGGRTARLCGAAFLRAAHATSVWKGNSEELAAVDLLERLADGGASDEDAEGAIAAVAPRLTVSRHGNPWKLLLVYLSARLRDARGELLLRLLDGYASEFFSRSSFPADLLREIFGSPFRPIAFSANWRTSDAVALACQMYESRDFGAMPVLADALQEAGCDSDELLSHLRDPKATHVRGCWALDLVLGKGSEPWARSR
jgi:hypothetical protein